MIIGDESKKDFVNLTHVRTVHAHFSYAMIYSSQSHNDKQKTHITVMEVHQ